VTFSSVPVYVTVYDQYEDSNNRWFILNFWVLALVLEIGSTLFLSRFADVTTSKNKHRLSQRCHTPGDSRSGRKDGF